MPESAGSTEHSPLSPHSAAFLNSLTSHLDAWVTKQDLKEDHPDLIWTGMVSRSWNELFEVPELKDRLVTLGEGSSTVYSLISNENDISLLTNRLNHNAEIIEKTDAEAKEKSLWRKRAAAAGALAALLAGGAAISLHRHRKSK